MHHRSTNSPHVGGIRASFKYKSFSANQESCTGTLIIFLQMYCHFYIIIRQLAPQLTGWLLLWNKVVHRSTLWHWSRCIIVRNTSWLSYTTTHRLETTDSDDCFDTVHSAMTNKKHIRIFMHQYPETVMPDIDIFGLFC